MRRVLDQLFCEELSFRVSAELIEDSPAALRGRLNTAASRSDYVKAWCELAGLELLEYDTALIRPSPNPALGDFTYIELHSKAFNAKALR